MIYYKLLIQVCSLLSKYTGNSLIFKCCFLIMIYSWIALLSVSVICIITIIWKLLKLTLVLLKHVHKFFDVPTINRKSPTFPPFEYELSVVTSKSIECSGSDTAGLVTIGYRKGDIASAWLSFWAPNLGIQPPCYGR